MCVVSFFVFKSHMFAERVSVSCIVCVFEVFRPRVRKQKVRSEVQEKCDTVPSLYYVRRHMRFQY